MAPGSHHKPETIAAMCAKRLTWTDDMTAAARRLRSGGASIEACAERVGVSESAMTRKLRELGLLQVRRRAA